MTFDISSQPIAGYVPVDQLNNFGPSVEFILQPGEGLTVSTDPQPPQSTPEPSIVGSLFAISFGAFLKRKTKTT